MRIVRNSMKVVFAAVSENEAFARTVITGFIARYDITTEELADVKTAVSEAVTNAIVHGYRDSYGFVTMEARLYLDGELYIAVSDKGCGIEDVKKAMEPFYTTASLEERCGMGFAIMKSFTDKMKVTSVPGRGTKVILRKKLQEAKY